jgi:glycerol-3-phosphate dehydrogenase
MRITLMTPDQRDRLTAELGLQHPAAPELVAATVACATGVLRSDVRAVAARLIEAEQLLDTTRRTLARAATSDYHHSISDLLWELTQAGAGITDAELDAAEATAAAEARAEALR